MPAPPHEHPHFTHWTYNCSDLPWRQSDKYICPIGYRAEAEREDFHNAELTHLLQDANTHILLASDFNCVLHPNDNTGHYHTSRALTEIVRGMALTDALTQSPLRPSYTHYTSNCASRLDRFYVTGDLLTQKLLIETLPATFTDHLVVVLHISVPSVEPRRGWRRWKMNPHLMDNADIKLRVRHEFGQWTKYKQYYPDVTSWWERCVDKRLRQLIRRAESERYTNHRTMENHLYQCMYDVLRSDTPEAEKFLILKRYKAKIVCLHARRNEKLMLDVDVKNKIEDEESTLFHILKRRKRCEGREVRVIQDRKGHIYTRPQDILDTFITHLT